MRVLITVQPQMYREALAVALRRHRPDAEVVLGSPESLDSQMGPFSPHLLLRNDTDRDDMDQEKGVLCWIEILYSDSLDAKVSIDGEVWNIEDISMDDLMALVDKVEKLIPEETTKVIGFMWFGSGNPGREPTAAR